MAAADARAAFKSRDAWGCNLHVASSPLLLRRHPKAGDMSSLMSSQLPWLYTMALALFANGTARDYVLVPASFGANMGGPEMLQMGLAGWLRGADRCAGCW